MEVLLTKLNILQDHLEEIEQKTRLRESNQEKIESARDINMQAKLDQLENKLNRIVPYSSCKEIPTNVSGIYDIQFGSNKTRLLVYCVQKAFGGGWILFQDRYYGKVNFNRNWNDYRDGFGDLKYEFWLGLKHLHQLTSERPHELIVQVKDFNGSYGYAHYDQFMIGSESEGYSLKIGNYKGTAGDALKFHNNMKFSTKDKDNDLDCAFDD
uniref:Fibrinogen C-terminal domain-containing protein n=1 Tax=Anopheles atroparvus TaxID=41427 RepID=A0A182IYV5_ANOAO